MTGYDYIRALLEHFGAPTDAELARRLRWHRQEVSYIKNGNRPTTIAQAETIGRILKIDPARIYADTHEATAADSTARQIWHRISQALAAGLAGLPFAALLLWTPDAQAAMTHTLATINHAVDPVFQCILCKIRAIAERSRISESYRVLIKRMVTSTGHAIA